MNTIEWVPVKEELEVEDVRSYELEDSDEAVEDEVSETKEVLI